MDFYVMQKSHGNKLEIEPWAKAENMEMVLGQNELWSRRYGIPTKKKNHKVIVSTKIRHKIAYRLHQLADYVEPNENIHMKRYAL